MILITSLGEFPFIFYCQFLFISLKKKKTVLQDCFCVPYLCCRITFTMGLNCDKMEEGKQYSEYSVESNPRAYMTMRDYRNQSWQSQQPVERNPNEYMTMRDYRNQWMGTPSYNVTPTYAPPPHPQYASLSEPQPPQPISLVEQAILDLTKLVGDAVGEQKKFNAQLSQKFILWRTPWNKH